MKFVSKIYFSKELVLPAKVLLVIIGVNIYLIWQVLRIIKRFLCSISLVIGKIYSRKVSPIKRAFNEFLFRRACLVFECEQSIVDEFKSQRVEKSLPIINKFKVKLKSILKKVTKLFLKSKKLASNFYKNGFERLRVSFKNVWVKIRAIFNSCLVWLQALFKVPDY